MKLEQRHVLLILDNAAGHDVDALTDEFINASIQFLLPNTPYTLKQSMSEI